MPRIDLDVEARREVLVIDREDPRRWTPEKLLRRQDTRQLELFGRAHLLPALEGLPALERLHLWGISLRDPQPVLRCQALKKLVVTLGRTHDFSFVEGMPHLQELWIIRVRALDSISHLRGPTGLRVLWLENLPRLCSLPDLSLFPVLERLELIALPALNSLEPVLNAKALRQMKIGLAQANESMLSVLSSHSTLNAVAIGTGSARRNRTLSELLRFSGVYSWGYALLPELGNRPG